MLEFFYGLWLVVKATWKLAFGLFIILLWTVPALVLLVSFFEDYQVAVVMAIFMAAYYAVLWLLRKLRLKLFH